MEIYVLAVMNNRWWNNIIANKAGTINYFTKGINPTRAISEVHFVKDGKVVGVGKFKEAYKAHIQDVYANHGNIVNGLNALDTYVDFVNLVGTTLPQDNILGNIIVDDFEYNLDGYKVSYDPTSNRSGVYVPITNKILK